MIDMSPAVLDQVVAHHSCVLSLPRKLMQAQANIKGSARSGAV